MRDGLFGFVSHVGKTKCLALQLAVAAVDHKVMLVAQLAHQPGDVDAAVVLHARERDRAMSFRREKLEPALAHPIVHHRVRVRVPFVALRQPFCEDFLELRLQGEDVANARRRRGHVTGLLFFELEKIEVIASTSHLLRARERPLGNAEKRETGRRASAFCEPVRSTSMP